MGLIKSEHAPTKLAAFSLADIEAQANAIIVRAKSQASRILIESQRLAEEIKKQAQDTGWAQGRDIGFQRGHEEGLDAGRQQALAEHRESLQRLIDALTAASVELNESRRMLETEASTDVLRLSVAIARKVTKQFATDGPSVVTANVREAMKLAVHASDVRIAIHPSQKQTLEAILPELQTQWSTLEHVSLIEDESLTPGGCRIFTAGGQIDSDLENQINRIAAELIPKRKEDDPRIHTNEHE